MQRGLKMLSIISHAMPGCVVLSSIALPAVVVVILNLSFMISRAPWLGAGVLRYWALGISLTIVLGGICFLILLRLELAERLYRARLFSFCWLPHCSRLPAIEHTDFLSEDGSSRRLF